MNAVLIMCHKNIEQVKMLVNRCLSENTRIIIHFDKRMQINKQELQDIQNLGVYFTEERVCGELDTRSLVDISMAMVLRAKEIENLENIRFKYYLLLSGQDYPIKPISYINNELEKMYPTPFIDCTPYSNDNWIYHKFSRTKELLRFHNWVTNNIPKKSIMYPLRVFSRIVEKVGKKIVRIFHITDYHKMHRAGIDLYGGSAWWILPDIAIDYICKEYNSTFSKKLLNTYTPEETYFQTMVMRSDVKDLVAVNPPDMVAQNCKTWAYFEDIGKPFKGHPYIFTVDEYDKLTSSDRWFARKFDITVDSNIFGLLNSFLGE